MRILIPGNPKALMKYKKFKCNTCGCVFVTDDYSTVPTNYNDRMYEHVCPCCGYAVHNYSDEFCTEDGKYV